MPDKIYHSMSVVHNKAFIVCVCVRVHVRVRVLPSPPESRSMVSATTTMGLLRTWARANTWNSSKLSYTGSSADSVLHTKQHQHDSNTTTTTTAATLTQGSRLTFCISCTSAPAQNVGAPNFFMHGLYRNRVTFLSLSITFI